MATPVKEQSKVVLPLIDQMHFGVTTGQNDQTDSKPGSQLRQPGEQRRSVVSRSMSQEVIKNEIRKFIKDSDTYILDRMLKNTFATAEFPQLTQSNNLNTLKPELVHEFGTGQQPAPRDTPQRRSGNVAEPKRLKHQSPQPASHPSGDYELPSKPIGKSMSITDIRRAAFRRPRLAKVSPKRTSLPKIRWDKSGLKVDIDKKYGRIFEKNIPSLQDTFGFSRAQLINYFTLFKALLQFNGSLEGIDFETFRAGLGEMLLSNPSFARHLYDICKERSLDSKFLGWDDFLIALKLIEGKEFTEESDIVVKKGFIK
eukprot:CAMPEP_0168338348 /NCGR_PEP_ID=MMETSP0213-20121227/12776_1 /TAXON_ID=151035 /ORGANISM="Euplotes harpa, Strain FSP1.4" /LENGTH=312 /DNA_ID=CAMNT_0008344099 /DNA_START=1170 /DNA_END=2106 /DNA_ORIENTATION=-